jgi:hypothetical protein
MVETFFNRTDIVFFRNRLSNSQSIKHIVKIEKNSILLCMLPEINKPRKRDALKNHDLLISQSK